MLVGFLRTASHFPARCRVGILCPPLMSARSLVGLPDHPARRQVGFWTLLSSCAICPLRSLDFFLTAPCWGGTGAETSAARKSAQGTFHGVSGLLSLSRSAKQPKRRVECVLRRFSGRSSISWRLALRGALRAFYGAKRRCHGLFHFLRDTVRVAECRRCSAGSCSAAFASPFLPLPASLALLADLLPC